MNNRFSEELLLTNKTGSNLYHRYAKDLPIIDYHCHLQAKEIYENNEFDNLGEMWLSHDHYKWRVMRTFGIDEHYITGTASCYEKYQKFACLLPRLAGNPIYIWCALELKRYFDIDEPLGPDNAERIYYETKKKIKDCHMTPRWCMEQSKVEILSTTEDPADTLKFHKLIQMQPSIKTKILTAFRPDQAFYCDKSTFVGYLKILSASADHRIYSFQSLIAALELRLAYFADFGTTVSDNGIADITWCSYTMDEVETVYQKAAGGQVLSASEKNKYQSAFVIEMAKLYKKYGFVMQLHIGTYLDANRKGVQEIGQSTGFDCVDDTTAVQSIGAILNHLTELNQLPKTILYPLNSSQLEPFAILAAGFCDGTTKAKVQLGAPWWFNDQSYGIERQFCAAGNLYPVSLSVGMLTDSRSFLSYPRHELYRRVLCCYLGELVERGEYFSDEKYLKEIIESICYYNVKEYFGW